MKRRLLSLAQFAVGIAVVAFIIARMESRGELERLVGVWRSVHDNGYLVATAFLIFGTCMLFGIQRWRLILGALGVEMPAGRVSELYFIGLFFNAFLLGATGGDLVKAGFVARQQRTNRTEAVLSIFIDRTVGLIALVALTTAVMLLNLPFFLSTGPTRFALFFVVAMFAWAMVLVAVARRKDLIRRLPFHRRIERSPRAIQTLARAHESFRFCMGHPSLLAKTLALSALGHTAAIIGTFHLGLAAGIPLGFGDYLVMFFVINAIASLPITPSGLGTRESASVLLLGVLGVAATSAVTLSLLIYAMILLWSLVGAVVYAAHVCRKHESASEAIAEAEQEERPDGDRPRP